MHLIWHAAVVAAPLAHPHSLSPPLLTTWLSSHPPTNPHGGAEARRAWARAPTPPPTCW